MASEKQEALNALKAMSKENVVAIGKKYMSGGGFGDVNKMTKGKIIDILMSGKTSYYKAGGMVKKMRGGGAVKMASKKKMRGGGMAKTARKNMMRGGAVKKKMARGGTAAKKKMMRGGAVKKK